MEAFPVSAKDSKIYDNDEEEIVTAAKTLLALKHSGQSSASSTAITTPSNAGNLTRYTGYGDFCFGRKPLSGIPSCLKISGYTIYTDEEAIGLRLESSYHLVSETGEFERTGSFLFLNLPLDVRLQILGLLVAPLFKYNSNTKKHILRLKIENDDPDILASYFDGGLEANLAGIARITLVNGNMLAGVDSQPHPERSYPYRCNAQVEMLRLDPSRIDTDWLMIEHFRHELGSVIWTSIHLEIDGSDYSATSQSFFAFLKERPAIHRSIKSIHIKLNCIDQGYYNLAHISRWCEYLNGKVELASLSIDLIAERKDLEHLVLGGGPLSHLLSVRNLTVTSEEFKFMAYVCETKLTRVGALYEENRTDYVHYLMGLQRRFREPIRQVLMPNTIRQSRLATKHMEEYRKARTTRHSSGRRSGAPILPATEEDGFTTVYNDLFWFRNPPGYIDRLRAAIRLEGAIET
ncbi:uncharacterized protein RAG0_15851 [Rhynchosporium agropyri]|uniref:Uncharacterized protein n=1 Tax=Rhynchosporium agropyri TaxID=914238 RepID=A0A1E1LMV6_9HELO|nr:uncharacterized protein RAG0_15851 [Rhynchosporium agropyri]